MFKQPQPLAIGAIKADCPNCHSFLFVPSGDGSDATPALLRCVKCQTPTPYTVLLGRVSSAVIEHAERVLAEANGILKAVRNAEVDEPVRKRLEEYIARSTKDSRIAIALMRSDRLEYRVVNASYAAIRDGGTQYLGRSYRDVFPEAADLGVEAKLREVIATRKPWKIGGFKTPIPGRRGTTCWDGECVPVASSGDGVDSVLVVNWEVTDPALLNPPDRTSVLHR